VHLIRNTFRLTSKRDWDAMKRDVQLIYTAVNAAAAGRRSTSWRRSGEAAQGRDPTLGERLGAVHPVPRLRPGDPHRDLRWKSALNAFAITFADRFPSAETY
jgi:transposase-like protein